MKPKNATSTVKPAWFILGNQEHYTLGGKKAESHLLAIRDDLEMWPLTAVTVLQAVPMVISVDGKPVRDADRGYRNVLDKMGEITDAGLKAHFDGYSIYWLASASNASAEFVTALMEQILNLPGAFKVNEVMSPERKIATPKVSEQAMTF